jgi:hypothetical protein
MRLKPFKEVPHDNWLPARGRTQPFYVYKSAQYLVQVFIEENGVFRLSINSVKRQGSNWKDGITFDELQAIKSAVGFGDCCAVEVYPEDSELVNDANMRHLWVLPVRPSFAWTSKNRRTT